MKLSAVILSALLLVLSGCSFSRVKGVLAGSEKQEMRLLAVLPVERAADLPRERVEIVRKRIVGELQGKGFVLVDDAVVSRVCSLPACPEREKLAKDYGVDGFVSIRVDSVSRANFLAGYVNTVSGGLSVWNLKGEEILTVSQSERERGGILFNTGQVAQAIRSTAENTNTDQSFSQLASRYAKTLVSQIPPPAKTGEVGSNVTARIDDVKVVSDKTGFDEVCLTGSKDGIAYFVYDRERSNLREIAPGQYCGKFRSQDLAGYQDLEVELRSVYGDVAQKKVALLPETLCRPKDPLVITKNKGQAELAVVCSNNVTPARFNVYRATGPLSPFERVASVNGSRWVNGTAVKNDQTYAVVVVGKSGQGTTPVLATISE